MFTYYNSKVTEERKARIERINEQVSLIGMTPHTFWAIRNLILVEELPLVAFAGASNFDWCLPSGERIVWAALGSYHSIKIGL